MLFNFCKNKQSLQDNLQYLVHNRDSKIVLKLRCLRCLNQEMLASWKSEKLKLVNLLLKITT